MKWLLGLSIVVMGCTGHDDGGDDGPDPATCPAAPFEVCIVHDNGWEVWCENGAVFANDMTMLSYCAPDSHEVVCTTGGRSISQIHTCPTMSCRTDERRYFDYLGDYQAFEPSTLCQN